MKPVADLIRFVVGPDDVLVPDTDAKAEGRGVWITPRRECGRRGGEEEGLRARASRPTVTLPEDLPALTRQRLEQRFLGAVRWPRRPVSS